MLRRSEEKPQDLQTGSFVEESAPMASPPARSSLGCLWVTLPLILLFATAPLISVILSTSIAESAGCNIHEGNANTCLILGVDVGRTLYAMFLAGWLSFVTLPVGLGLLVLWLVVALIMWRRRIKDRAVAKP